MSVTEAPPAAAAAPPRGRMPYFPGLDGLRGVAVGAVLLFHSGFTWMQGGYLGVSTFFTLSGFLITSLLLTERGATGEIDLRAFWRRRWRRLMPAAFATFVLVALFGAFAADAVQRRNLAGDVLAAMAYVANWRFIFTEQSYADLFAAPSPVLHFWSLAIEEQFYLLYPLLAGLLLAWYRVRRAVFGLVLGALALASFSLPFVFTLTNDRIYFGTDTRAAELLIGGLLAVLLYHRRVTHRLATDRTTRLAVVAAGGVALGLCAAAWVLVPQRSPVLYEGGLSAYALLSALVIAAAITPASPVRALLAVRPLRWLGTISYGVYLYHWPVFLWVSEERTGWPSAVVLVVRFAITFALAMASYRWLEMPVRRGQRLFGGIPAVRLLPVAAAGVAVAVVALTVTAPKPVIDFDQAAAELQSVGAAPPPPTADPASNEPPFPRIAMFGDSTAMMTAFGLNAWSIDTKKAQFVDGAAWLGCGIGRGGERRSGKDEGPIPEHCNHWELTWAQKVRDNKPNIAVVQIGPWEVADRKLEGDTVWRAPGDPVYDQYLLKEMTLAVDTLSGGGADVIWLTSPPVGAGQGQDARQVRGQAADPARMARLNQLINQLPSLRPGQVHVVDLAGWLSSSGDDARLRPDGVHFGPDESKEASERFLGNAVIDAFRQDWQAKHDKGAEIAAGGPTTPGTTAAPAPGTTASPPGTAAPGGFTYTGPKRKVLVLGDDTATPIVDGLTAFGKDTGALDVVSVTQPCGILKVSGRDAKGNRATPPPDCNDAVFLWLQAVVNTKPDLVLIVPSVWDLTDQQLTGDDQWRGPGDKVFDTAMADQYRALAEALHKTGALVAWLTEPPVDWGRSDDPRPNPPPVANDTARLDKVNGAILDVPRSLPPSQAYVLSIDLAKHLREEGADHDWSLRPDGVTFTPQAARTLADWLGPELLTRYLEYQANGN